MAKAPPPVGYGYWAISDIYEEIDTGPALTYREGNYGLFLKGDPGVPESFDVAKPAFNAFRLSHWLGNTRIAVAGGTAGTASTPLRRGPTTRLACRCSCTTTRAGAAVEPAGAANVTLRPTNLAFSAGPLVLRHYLLDGEHSNSYTAWVAMDKPARPTAEQWATLRDAADLCYYESEIELENGTMNVTFPQRIHGISLITLTPRTMP